VDIADHGPVRSEAKPDLSSVSTLAPPNVTAHPPRGKTRSGKAQAAGEAAGAPALPPPKREVDPQEIARFKRMVQQKVDAAKQYPSEARLAEQEGQVRVSFAIGRNGQPSQIKVAQSSGHAALDQAATATISRAAPFLPFPESVSAPAVQVTVAVSFKLK